VNSGPLLKTGEEKAKTEIFLIDYFYGLKMTPAVFTYIANKRTAFNGRSGPCIYTNNYKICYNYFFE